MNAFTSEDTRRVPVAVSPKNCPVFIIAIFQGFLSRCSPHGYQISDLILSSKRDGRTFGNYSYITFCARLNNPTFVGFEVLTAVRITIFSVVTPCRLVRRSDVSEKRTVSIFRVEVAVMGNDSRLLVLWPCVCFECIPSITTSALWMETRFSETLVSTGTYESAWHHNPRQNRLTSTNCMMIQPRPTSYSPRRM